MSECFDISFYPIKAQGTIDGIQYGTEVATVLAATNYELLIFRTCDSMPRLIGNLAWVYYNISFELKAGNTTADLKWKLQARNKEGTWSDMCAEQTETDINTTYVAKKIEGYLDINDNVRIAPFEMRLIFQSNEAGAGIGIGRVKNDTLIRTVGEIR